jgi:cellobiose phosphorylase
LEYADTAGNSAISLWPKSNPDKKAASPSYGIPMKALSTNCLYYSAYVLLTEIYHPTNGSIFGGLQERAGKGIVPWASKPRQTWAASAYLRMILFGLVGMQVSRDGIRFEPCIPEGISQIDVVDLHLRNARMDLAIKGKGVRLRTLTVSGVQLPPESVIPWDSWGQRKLNVVMEMQ